MGTYKGNVGHLMQHWTFCKILSTANKHTPGLNYIDAHAMAPLATKRDKPTKSACAFDHVRAGLPGNESVYERAWHRLVPGKCDGYPNSAAFVRQVWKEYYSLLLCENRPQTVCEIEDWLPATRELPMCMRAKLFPRDWREKFKEGLPSPCEVGLPDDSLTLVAFDPYKYNIHPPQPTKPDGMLYPKDLELTLRALDGVKGGVLIQVSTYNAKSPNRQAAVISSVNSVLFGGGFALVALVIVNQNMMSLIYTRDVKWAADLAELPNQFEKWRRR